MHHFNRYRVLGCGLWLATSALHAADTRSASLNPLETITVTATQLNEKRAGIETQTGASTYTIDDAAIAATPGADNTLLNQVVLQAPDVAQDSFGQFHVRGDHNDLQYRLNGIIQPEGISVFRQSLSPRLIASLQLITGALTAEYGLRTAGIIDMTTRSGVAQPGGSVSICAGGHGTFEPSVYGGSLGSPSYLVSGDLLRNDLGTESPDGSADPLHDHSTQYHGFGYFEDIIDASNRVSAILGTSTDRFQIRDQGGLQPDLGWTVNGHAQFPSAALNENQRESTSNAILSWQHSQGAWDWQSSLSSRYSSLSYEPDTLGDLLYDRIAQQAFKRDVALAWQTDAAFRLNQTHTLRAGVYLQHDDTASDTLAQVVATDADGAQISSTALAITDNGFRAQWIESIYLQGEWKAVDALTVNHGVRIDHYRAYSSLGQLSPRVNVVWNLATDTLLHAGFSRYFTPPPFEPVGGETVAKFADTSAAPAVALDSAPIAERSSYLDAGFEHKIYQIRDGCGVGVGAPQAAPGVACSSASRNNSSAAAT